MTDQRVEILTRNAFIKNLMGGRFVLPKGSGARTDAAKDFEVNAYVSGATIVIQVYDLDAGAWRSVSLT